jgi:hypothetical protein
MRYEPYLRKSSLAGAALHAVLPAPFATLATFTLAQDEFRSAAFASPHRYKQIKDERDENTIAIKSN